AAAAEAERWPLGRQPPQGPLAEMVTVNMGQQHQLEFGHIRRELLVGHAAIYQHGIVEDHGVALAAGCDNVVPDHYKLLRSTASTTSSISGRGISMLLGVPSIWSGAGGS